ncbi:MAG: response regulator [Abitibacteriaceae bacterium]|nr:response regulator [Abditibacteriaceae bacterium]
MPTSILAGGVEPFAARREQAPETVRARRAFLAYMRDELHTPLDAIIGYSEILLADFKGPEHARFTGDLEKIHDEGERMLGLTNDILNTSKTEEIAATDLDLEAFGARIRYEMRTPLTAIIGYCELLLEETGAVCLARCADHLRKIHAAAQQLLALIDELVRFSKIQAGVLELDLNSPEVTPMIRELVAVIRPLAEDKHETPQVSQGRILVADDSKVSRELLSHRLRQQGYETFTVADGQQALDTLAEQAFDLVLLDIMMPGMNGYQVLEHLKADNTLRYIPVIMISALDEIDSVVRCIELGAEDYLPKQFNPVLLQARVGACLEKKRLRDQEVQLFKQLEENYGRLQELESLRDSLTDMIVHDLRTPLTSLLGGLSMIRGMGELNPTQLRFLAISLRGGETLLGMINDLLDISKMEAGSLAPQLQELSAMRLIELTLLQIEQLALENNQTLITDIAPVLPSFQGDEDQLRRTLVNLTGNAIKFTPRGGTITLAARLSDDGNALRFAVSDTGEGIPPEAFERIFEKFGQVDSRQNGHKLSTGLGLTFCKMVVEAHGGNIWVESELGRGSTFFFTIPLKLNL